MNDLFAQKLARVQIDNPQLMLIETTRSDHCPARVFHREDVQQQVAGVDLLACGS